MWCQAWIIFSISSLLLDGFIWAMITLILCHNFSIGLRSGDWAGQFMWATLWDCIHLFTNFAWWQGALSSWNIQYSSGNKLRAQASNFVSNTAAYLVAFHHPLTYVQSSNVIWCHTTPNHHTSWMLDSRRNARRAKRFLRSFSNKVVSSMILNSKGTLITKYDLIPILTCPVQMLFCPSNPGLSLFFRYFWLLFRFASP